MLSRTLYLFSLCLASALIASCATKTPAPVTDRRVNASSPQPASAQANRSPAASATSDTANKPGNVEARPAVKQVDLGKTHTLQKGETLYSIALQNNIDHRELAMWNNIDNPNVIKAGDSIRLSAPNVPSASTTASATSAATQATVVTPLILSAQPSATTERGATNSTVLKTEPQGGKLAYTDQALTRLNNEAITAAANLVSSTQPAGSTVAAASTAAIPTGPAPVLPSLPGATTVTTQDAIEWNWPVKGKVITTFTELNKGIDIAGARGTAVNAAAAGTVLHTGAGIRGYGRLVIVKHSTGWVSAYAHNDKIVVTEGQEVKRGQKIAEMGNSDADQVKLHFEIRRQGKPIDPLSLLPK